MSKYSDTRSAITSAIQAADIACPVANIYDRFRDPKAKNKQAWIDLFGDSDGITTKIHGYHFDRRAMPNMSEDSNSGDPVAVTSTETWEIHGLRSFIDDGPDMTTHTNQEVIDNFRTVLFVNDPIQDLGTNYNMVLQTVSVDDIGYTYLAGEMKCHLVEISLTFQIIY